MTQVNAANELELSAQPHDLEWMMVDTRLRQSEAARKLVARTNRWFLRLSGLTVAGKAVNSLVVEPLRLSLLRRKTISNLQQLDDRLLADIGIERFMIADVVDQLIAEEYVQNRGAAEKSPSSSAVSHSVVTDTAADVEALEVVAPIAAIDTGAVANSNTASHRAA